VRRPSATLLLSVLVLSFTSPGLLLVPVLTPASATPAAVPVAPAVAELRSPASTRPRRPSAPPCPP
jgi:hypothetical protein